MVFVGILSGAALLIELLPMIYRHFLFMKKILKIGKKTEYFARKEYKFLWLVLYTKRK